MRPWDVDSSPPARGGYLSVNNSSSTPLTGDAVFTGVAEPCGGFSSLSVFIFADAASAADGLSFELSTDGTNWDRAKTVTVAASATQVHTLAIVSRYFRVVYTNGSGAQSAFRLQTIYHTDRAFGLISGTQQTLQAWDDVNLVRSATDPHTDLNTGRIAYQTAVHKFGRNADVGTGAYEDLWDAGGTYNWLQAASAVRIRTGGNAADDTAGLGAQTIVVEGLDENWAQASETITTAGASVSSPTATTFIRVFRAYVANVGTYTGANTGDILIETTGGTLVADILAGLGQSQMAIYSIPAGKTGYIRRLSVSVSAGTNKSASVRVFKRENADDASTPFTGKRLIGEYDEVAGEVVRVFDSWIPLAAKADVWIDAIGDANATLVDASFDLVLVDN